MESAATPSDEQWAQLDEDLVDDVDILRFIIKQQRHKLLACNRALGICLQKEKLMTETANRYADVIRQAQSAVRGKHDCIPHANLLYERTEPLYKESLVPDPYLSTAGKKGPFYMIPEGEVPGSFFRDLSQSSLHPIDEGEEETSRADADEASADELSQ